MVTICVEGENKAHKIYWVVIMLFGITRHSVAIDGKGLKPHRKKRGKIRLRHRGDLIDFINVISRSQTLWRSFPGV